MENRGVHPFLEYNKTYRMRKPSGAYTLYHLKKLAGDQATLLNLNTKKEEVHSRRALERLLSLGDMYVSAQVTAGI